MPERDKPLSLHPLSFRDAIRWLSGVRPQPDRGSTSEDDPSRDHAVGAP